MTLVSPATFAFAIPVLQIENRIAFSHILVVFRRGIYKAVADCLTGLAVVVNFAQLTVRYVLHSIKILILCWNFDIVSPRPRTEYVCTARIRHIGTIYYKPVVVIAFIERIRSARPNTLFIFGQGIRPIDIQQDTFCFRSLDAYSDAPL